MESHPRYGKTDDDAELKTGRLSRFLLGIDAVITMLLPWRWVMWALKPAFERDFDEMGHLPLSDADEITESEIEPEPGPGPGPEAEPVALWPDERVTFVEKLWGEDCTLPSSRSFISTYFPLMAMTEKKSLALLGANMGGVGYAMVNETGVWVTALEANAELAKIGAERSIIKGMKKKAGVKLSDFEHFNIKAKSLDGVVSLETLYTVKNKEDLIKTACAGLRVDGELFLIDFVLPDASPPNEVVVEWYKSEPLQPYLWTAVKTQSFLTSLGLDMRPPQDITRDYRGYVLLGWLNFLKSVSKAELQGMADVVLKECELWMRRVAALDSGGLQVCKFNAFQPPGLKPEKSIEVGTGSDNGALSVGGWSKKK